MRYLFLFMTVLCCSSQAQNYSKKCTDVDANSVKQVQACIASSSQMSYGLDSASKDFGGCARMKQMFSALTGIRMDADSDMMPNCHVFARVLENLNGKKATWTSCIDFAENQTNLSSCYGALKKSQKITNTFESKTCLQVKNALWQVITGMSGNYMTDQKKLPGCEKIAVAMRENNHEMSGYACGKYKPDSQKHINACLHSYFAAYKYYGMQMTQSCDQLRHFYHAGVKSMFDGEKTVMNYGAVSEPSDFQVAQCDMLEAAVDSYNEEQYAYEQFDNTAAAEEPVQKTSNHRAKTQEVEEEDEPVRKINRKQKTVSSDEEEEGTLGDGKSLLKQMALDRTGESKSANKTLNKAAEYQEKYDEATEEVEEYEEEEESEDIEKTAKKKLTKKLFDKLGL